MSLFFIEAPVTITCNKFMVPSLEQEMQELGFTDYEVFTTGVRLYTTIDQCIQLNLGLRCGSQILFSLDQFEAVNGDEIYDHLLDIAWEDIIPEGEHFSVTSNVQNSTINNSMYANLRVKDAVVDRLRQLRGRRPETGSDLTGVVIHLYWKDDFAEIFIDTSGDSLARHGYRKIPGTAPMLEALAASVIYSSRWDRRSVLINPMCGSGTLAIEAALLASNTAPGLFRDNYSFMHLQGYDAARYAQERGRLEQQITEPLRLRIIASDHSEKAVANARKNARAAGVEELITFSVCDFEQTEVPELAPGEKGVMIVNPEYGERLGDISALEATYARIGDFMKKKLMGYYGYVFTGNRELAKKIGLKPNRRIPYFNSTIDCRLLEYELYSGTRNPAQ